MTASRSCLKDESRASRLEPLGDSCAGSVPYGGRYNFYCLVTQHRESCNSGHLAGLRSEQHDIVFHDAVVGQQGRVLQQSWRPTRRGARPRRRVVQLQRSCWHAQSAAKLRGDGMKERRTRTLGCRCVEVRSRRRRAAPARARCASLRRASTRGTLLWRRVGRGCGWVDATSQMSMSFSTSALPQKAASPRSTRQQRSSATRLSVHVQRHSA